MCGPNFGRMLGHFAGDFTHIARFARDACLARFARYSRCARNIPGTQDEAARVMDEILTPIPIDLRDMKR